MSSQKGIIPLSHLKKSFWYCIPYCVKPKDRLLHLASQSGSLEITNYLIAHGKDIELQIKEIFTPLYYAYQNDYSVNC